jgi:hypothetical protein
MALIHLKGTYALLAFWEIAFCGAHGNNRLCNEAGIICGTHQKDGVLFAYGSGIKRGIKAPDAEIYDLFPAVLHCMVLPLPHLFDDRILDEL